MNSQIYKLYIITRADLSPGQQLAQSCHAVSVFAKNHPALFKEWMEHHQTIVCLSVPDEPSLNILYNRFKSLQSDSTSAVGAWYEPDQNNALTAIYAYGRPEDINPFTQELSLALK